MGDTGQVCTRASRRASEAGASWDTSRSTSWPQITVSIGILRFYTLPPPRYQRLHASYVFKPYYHSFEWVTQPLLKSEIFFFFFFWRKEAIERACSGSRMILLFVYYFGKMIDRNETKKGVIWGGIINWECISALICRFVIQEREDSLDKITRTQDTLEVCVLFFSSEKNGWNFILFFWIVIILLFLKQWHVLSNMFATYKKRKDQYI